MITTLDAATDERLGVADRVPLAGDHPAPEIVRVPLIRPPPPRELAEVVMEDRTGGELEKVLLWCREPRSRALPSSQE